MKEKCTAIVLAAGKGRRMGTDVQKQFLTIGGRPVLYYSLRCFEDAPFIEDIILVTGEDSVEYCRHNIVDHYGISKVRKVLSGGRERYDSVYAGLLACDAPRYVFIHDGARPFIDSEILKRAYAGVREHGACVVGMPVKDTVKIANGQGCVGETPDRRTIWTVQTPQVFSYSLIRDVHEKLRKEDMSQITDDSMMVERMGNHHIGLVEGSYKNIKITTPEDLLVAEAFLAAEQG